MRVGLNPEQRAAVEFGEGPLLVLAGAGSGKTRVLTARVARLIDEAGVPPERILAVTFTNKAAGEMRERIKALLGRSTRGMWIGTFHSICARILRREGDRASRDRSFSIYDEDDALRTLKDAMERVGLDPKRWSPGAVRRRISDAKNAVVGPADYSPRAFDMLSRAAADVYPVYQRMLEQRNAYDFDDLLFEVATLLERDAEVRERYARRFLHVLVDEYQDTNHAQYRIVKALARGHGNVCVVGDDDQSIYGWRGADLRNILDFERDFPGTEVVRLERNYRSTGSILEVANAVIACNAQRKPKRLRTERPGGEAVVVVEAPDERAEASWTVGEIQALSEAYGLADCAILYRTNAQSRAYEDALRGAGLPYRIVGGVRFYERREIKDVLAYLQLAVNPADAAAFGRAVSWPRRGVGAVTLERLAEAAGERGETWLGTARRAGQIEAIPTAGARSLARFADEIAELAELQRNASPRAMLEETVRRFGMAAALEDEEGGEDRLANLAELVSVAAEYDRASIDEADAEATDLELFLQSLALRSELDEADFGGEAVTLMTLHNAKGLEFPVVFVGGLEEGLFPLSRAYETEAGVEEERRLFYVGVTRAMDRLYLTHAERRWRYGQSTRSDPSSFLDEVPEGPSRRRIVGGGRRVSGAAGRRRGSGTAPWRRAAAGNGGPEANGGSGFSWRHDPTAGDAGTRAATGGGAAAGVTGEGGGGAATGGGADGGLRYDYADSQVPLELRPGARVVHPRFGEGEILAVTGQGSGTKADIEFESVGRKKVMVAYAGLRPA